jgi:hypothetical protein
MAKSVYVDKKGKGLVLELPAIGKVIFRDEKTGNTGNFNAVLLSGGKEKVIGTIDYWAPTYDNVIHIREIRVKEPFKKLGVGTTLFSALEARSQGKVVAARDALRGYARIADTLGHDEERGRMGDGPSRWREINDAKKWKKKTTLQIRARKRILRG